ncbi:MAG: NUDIX domain-containing protein [Nitrospirae bacterium]|nr:NUDIX domain-containing protein [Nitrospirota bacterium]
MTSDEEIFEVLDTNDRVIGLATRSEVHRDPSLIHRVVHVMVFNRQGDLLLQKRSMNKDIAPGRWDTSVGGHVNPGEEIHAAAVREMREELGIVPHDLQFLYRYLFRNHRESERVSTFSCSCDEEIRFNRTEIDEVRFWQIKRIKEQLEKGIFSSHFEHEFRHYVQQIEIRNKVYPIP